MTQLNNRVSVGFTDEEWVKIQLLKMKHFDKTYSQVVKDLILRSLDEDEGNQKERSER